LARALRLDDSERAHLHDLARAVQPAVASRTRRRAARKDVVRPGVQRLLDAITRAAAVVQNGHGDLLPGSRSEDALNLLGSWAATQRQTAAAERQATSRSGRRD
jgi:hypothetical protein